MTQVTSLCGLAPRRKQIGLTQQQLADRLGVERGALSMWELGRSWPPARLLPALADTLICTIDELYQAAASDADKDKRLQTEEQIMEAVCELCHWPHVYEDEETMYSERCDSCPAAAAVTAALDLPTGGESHA